MLRYVVMIKSLETLDESPAFSRRLPHCNLPVLAAHLLANGVVRDDEHIDGPVKAVP